MAERATECRGYVLAGGHSSRMGADKALLPFGSQVLALRIAERIQQVCGSVTLVGSRAALGDLGLTVIEDAVPDRGPLGGIHRALTDAEDALALIAGCDIPWITAEFLTALTDIARSSGADAVVPEGEREGLEPLCAVYAPACLPVIEQAFRSGESRVGWMLEHVRLRVFGRDEWRPYDRDGNLFCNLNTREDYEEARRQLARQQEAMRG